MTEMENAYLGRSDAPISEKCWKQLDSAMIEAAKSQLSGRRLIPMDGPFGFGLKVVPLEDSEVTEGISASAVIPVNHITATFCLGKRDLATAEKEPFFLDTNPVVCAAQECAAKEDNIIYNGSGNVPGLTNARGTGSLTLSKWDKIGTAADQIIDAVTRLDEAGVHGPCCMALAPSLYNLLLRRYPQGDGTELDHIRSIIAGDVIKAASIKKGGILLASGRQYCSLVVGQDMSIGYNGPSGDHLEFCISESLALRIRYPAAICMLR